LTLKNLPAYKIGTSKRSESIPKDRLFMPEGGAYDPTTKFTKTSAAAFGFGTSQRTSLEGNKKSRDPGPAEYQLPNKAFDTKYRFHMGIKTKEGEKDNIPGPG
jgi:hypothetical protein